MNRRTFIESSVGGAAMAMFAGAAMSQSQGANGRQSLPRRDRIRVAFLLNRSANVIDTAGPWEVFQDTMLHENGHHHPFELFTVAPKDDIIEMSGGLKVQPHYTLAKAPEPHVIVVPAQQPNDDAQAWLREASQGTDVTMSICTGAFHLARAGLLKSVPATTHHEFWDRFAKEFPEIELKRGLRFVDNGRIATAGGLTSGIDMALHVVARYFGDSIAQATAKYMEYQSEAWKV